MTPKLSILMAICNTDYPPAHYTGNAIGSVKTYTNLPYEIIVIDNNSTVELGGIKWDEIADKYVKNEENLGVAKAWNQGIKLAKGEYIAVLNNDIQVFDYWAEDLIEALEHVDLAMATPMYAYPYGRAKKAEELRLEWLKKEPGKYLSDFNDFSCFMVKKETYDKMGLFDENYGIGYGEDVDFRFRLEEKGMKSKSSKKVNIHHVGMVTGHTLSGQGFDLGAIMNANGKYTAKKWNLDKNGNPEFRTKHDKQVGMEVVNPEVSGIVVRTAKTGDKVYYISEGNAGHVSDLETLGALGFDLNDVKVIPHTQFLEYDIVEPIKLKIPPQKPVVVDTDPVLGHRINAKI